MKRKFLNSSSSQSPGSSATPQTKPTHENCASASESHDQMSPQELCDLLSVEKLPFVTSDLEGIGGVLKARNEYFQVEEIASWEPDGTGSHCIVTLQREGADTNEVISKLQRVFGCKPNRIGFAGLKDKYGTCSQRFSIDLQKGVTKLEQIPSVDTVQEMIQLHPDLPKLKVIGRPAFNSRKLRRGHLQGNRFKILVTEMRVPLQEAERRAKAVAGRLEATGIPNYVGMQRIGSRAKAALEGLRTLTKVQKFVEEQKKAVMERGARESHDTGDVGSSQAFTCSRKRYRKWCKATGQKELSYFSPGAMMKFFALQSSLFNAMLAERVRKHKFKEDFIGDIVTSQYGGVSSIKTEISEASADRTFCLPLIGPKTMECK